MLSRDLRYGLASARRAPGFSAVVVGVLALGIGANVAMFSIVDAVLLKPLPDAPDRIVGVWEAPRPGIVNSTKGPTFSTGSAWPQPSRRFRRSSLSPWL
jgi:hypothetical protein